MKLYNNIIAILIVLLIGTNNTLAQSNSQRIQNQDLEVNYCDDDGDGFMTFNIQEIESYFLQTIGLQNEYSDEQILVSTLEGNILKIDSPSSNPSLTFLCNYVYPITDIAIDLDQEITICSNNFISVDDNCVFNSFPYDAFQVNSLSYDNLGFMYYGFGNETFVRRVQVVNNLFNNITLWHDFQTGSSAGDFVLLNDKMYIAWTLASDNYRLYEVTLGANNNYVSHVDLGQIPNFTYGLASELGKLYGVTRDKLYEIDLDTFTFNDILINPNPADQWFGASGLHEAINFSTSTHLTVNDANNNANPITGNWTNTISGGQVIYIRIENSLTGEYDIVNFSININSYPNVNPPVNLMSCSDEETNLFDLSNVQDQMIINNQDALIFTYFTNYNNAVDNINSIPVLYQSINNIETIYVRVQNHDNDCYLIYEFDIINYPSPDVAPLSDSNSPRILSECYIDENNVGYFDFNDVHDEIILEDGDFIIEYYLSILDAENSSNTIYSPYYLIQEEQQEIFIKVIGNQGCYSISNFYINQNCLENSTSTSHLFFPKYITPNGDNIHDFWNVKGLSEKLKKESTITIYDRFGKIITTFIPGDSNGWDGTLNGQLLPSTDYWFTFKTNFGYIKSGHFALVR